MKNNRICPVCDNSTLYVLESSSYFDCASQKCREIQLYINISTNRIIIEEYNIEDSLEYNLISGKCSYCFGGYPEFAKREEFYCSLDDFKRIVNDKDYLLQLLLLK